MEFAWGLEEDRVPDRVRFLAAASCGSVDCLRMNALSPEIHESIDELIRPVPFLGGADDKEAPDRWQEGDSELELRKRIKRPKRYQVILHNDDYTSMEFVIRILQEYFRKTDTEAHHLMLQVHHKGRAVAGVYGKDIAETKVKDVTEDALANQMPLKCTMEPA